MILTSVVLLSAAKNSWLSGELWSRFSTASDVEVDPPEKIAPKRVIRMIGKIREKKSASGFRRYCRTTMRKSPPIRRPFTGRPPT